MAMNSHLIGEISLQNDLLFPPISEKIRRAATAFFAVIETGMRIEYVDLFDDTKKLGELRHDGRMKTYRRGANLLGSASMK